MLFVSCGSTGSESFVHTDFVLSAPLPISWSRVYRSQLDAYDRGMLMETSGPDSEVVKLLPPLTITDEELERGLAIIDESVAAVLD